MLQDRRDRDLVSRNQTEIVGPCAAAGRGECNCNRSSSILREAETGRELQLNRPRRGYRWTAEEWLRHDHVERLGRGGGVLLGNPPGGSEEGGRWKQESLHDSISARIEP